MDVRTSGGSNSANKWLLLTVNEDDTYNAVGLSLLSNTNATGKSSITQGEVQQSAPTHGAFTFTGGDLYYAGRYNKNANYQCLIQNEEYDWLAW